MKQHGLNKTISFFLLTVFLFLALPSSPVLGQNDSPSDDDVNQIAKQLYCPVCENVPLDECTTEACQGWRELIRTRLAEGWTEEEILDYFLAQYGDKVLGEPPRQGLNWLLYLFPPTVVVVGLALLLTKFRKPMKSHSQVDPGEKDPYMAQVERDLEDLGSS